jgi:hypothetical protein
MRILSFFLLLFNGFACASVCNHSVKLGNTTVIVAVEKNGRGKSFIHLHQNETTALKAAREIINKDGGSLITLIHPGARNIVFSLDNKHFEFDPNRIYSEQGIKKTLKEYGCYSQEAHSLVKTLASTITDLLPDGKVIAVHNNESYSLKDYLPGHSLASDAELLNFNSENYYRNFYLVTQKFDYTRLTNKKFNSVLQANSAIDDGSLSIFLANRDYINVEAGYDQLAAQVIMLKNA